MEETAQTSEKPAEKSQELQKPAQPIPTSKEKETQKSPMQVAEELLKRIDEGNKTYAEIVKKQEELLARQMISGRAEAGQANKTAEEEEEEKLNKQVKEALDKFR